MADLGNHSAMPVKQAILPIQRLDAKNFMLAMMEAVEKDQNSLTKMQIIDSQSTELAVKIESNIYEYWINELSHYASEIASWSKGSSKRDARFVAKYQALYNQASAEAQANESQEDGTVQSCQGQTSSDATNLQMKAQMIQGINSILTALTNMLGRVTA